MEIDAVVAVASEEVVVKAVVAVVARRWQVCPQQVFAWRREMRRAPVAAPDFVPIVAAAPGAEAMPLPPIEIELAGAVLRIAPGTEAAMLTKLLRAVRASVL